MRPRDRPPALPDRSEIAEAEPLRLFCLGVIGRAVVDQAAGWNRDDHLPMVLHSEHIVVGHPADRGGRELPFGAHRLDSATRAGSATTSMRSCDSDRRISYGVIPASRAGTSPVSISTPTPPRAAISAEELVSPAAPISCIATINREVMSSRLASSSSFGKGIADLNLGPPAFALLGEFLRRKAGTVDAVPAGPGTDCQQHVADAVRGCSDQVVLVEQSHAHRVHQRIAGVPGSEVHLAAEGGDSDAVSVIPNPANHAGKEVAVAGDDRAAQTGGC